MKLFDYQQERLERTKDFNRVAYYWDMGTGKTFVGAEKMVQLNERVNLILCQKSKVNDWYDHLMKYYFDDHMIFDLTTKRGYNTFFESIDNQYDITVTGIINYELAFRRSELLDLSGFTLMLDESSMIQNESAKRSKFALQLGDRASNIILLSGTPTSGKYENLWSQLHLLGWNISKKMFWNQYVEVKYLENISHHSIPIVTGYKNVDRLKRKMRDHGCDFLKTDEVIDLPDQVFNDVYMFAPKEYRKFVNHGVVTIDGDELVGDTSLTNMLYQRELCSQYNKNRTVALKDLFESTNESFVVFYNFNAELDQIKKVAYDCGREVGVVNGKDKSGLAMSERWNSNGEKNNYSLNHNFRCTPIIAIQYQAGAMGLNLQGFSRRLIYFSLPLSSELFEQSKKRIHRVGTKDTCFYYVLLCVNSVEEKIYKTLKKRRDYTLKLFERGEEK